MDFVHDALMSGRASRVLTLVDQWRRESALLEVAFSLTGTDVVRAFETAIPASQLPKSITVDHVTEFTSKAVEAWRRDDNAHRPHSSLSDLTPKECAHRPQDHVTAIEP
jgi:transposase InsO family protein